MKTTIWSVGLMILGAGLFAGGCAKKQSSFWDSIKNPETVAQLKSFVAEKEAQADAATNAPSPGFKKFFVVSEKSDWMTVSNAFEGFAETATSAPLPEMKAFFAAAEKGDWFAVNNAFEKFRNDPVQYERLRRTKWWTILEIWGAFDAFGEGDEKYSAAYASDIIASIPPGSIYFGGTEPGQCLITGMQKSHVNGDPFFTLSQSPLPNGTYLEYLRGMYGGKIHTPTGEDSQKAFQDYMEEAKQRLQNHQLKPGEDVRLDNGRVQVSGQMSVIAIKSLLTKVIFDKNPDREFYIEESFPFDWMRPYLEPHGIIFKLNRQPLPTLSDEIVQRDRDYWTKLTGPMIGGWLNDGTTVKEVAAFAEKVYAKHDYTGFTGDPCFVENAYSQKMFSKERSSIAGLYEWRARQSASDADKKRMQDAADFAFRQAWALCPDSPEVVVRYVDLLMSENRRADAILVAETAAKMPAMKGLDGGQIRALVESLQTAQIVK